LKALIATMPLHVKDLIAAKGGYEIVKQFIKYRAKKVEFYDCKLEENA
jgi:hypothetical protein